jgi:tRNA ligase
MGDRVLARGDNHQSLRADTVTNSHEDVLWMFLTQMEELEDDEVDVMVAMSVEDTLEQAVNKAIDGCVRVLGVERPSKERVDEALQVAMGYAPKTKKPDDWKKEKATPRYFGLLPEVDLVDILSPRLSPQDCDTSFWEDLLAKGRVTKRPHVTVVHRNSLPGASDLWEQCMRLHRMQSPPLFKFHLGHIVWNKRVMAVTVEDIEPASADGADSAKEFISNLPHDVRERLHITVGTKDANVPAIEAKTLIEDWRKGVKEDNTRTLDLEDVIAVGRVKGLFN